MVKGTQRRVIVVKSPDPRVFDEAIFVVREDFMRTNELSKDKLLDEANKAAKGYLDTLRRSSSPSTAIVAAVSTLSGTGLAYLIFKLIGA